MTLNDMIMEVVRAKDDKEREKAYRRLEKVGMDRMTVNVVIRDMAQRYRRLKEMKANG